MPALSCVLGRPLVAAAPSRHSPAVAVSRPEIASHHGRASYGPTAYENAATSGAARTSQTVAASDQPRAATANRPSSTGGPGATRPGPGRERPDSAACEPGSKGRDAHRGRGQHSSGHCRSGRDARPAPGEGPRQQGEGDREDQQRPSGQLRGVTYRHPRGLGRHEVVAMVLATGAQSAFQVASRVCVTSPTSTQVSMRRRRTDLTPLGRATPSANFARTWSLGPCVYENWRPCVFSPRLTGTTQGRRARLRPIAVPHAEPFR